MYIYFPAHEVKVTGMRSANLGRRGPAGDLVLCRDQTYLQDTSG